MGNCCTDSSPCDTVEERSGLLQQDATKPAVPAAETGGVVGAFQDSPEADDDQRKISDESEIKEEGKVNMVQVKQSPQARVTEPAKPLENGPTHRGSQPTEEERHTANNNAAQIKENVADIAQDNDTQETSECLPCTLEPSQTEDAPPEEQDEATAESDVCAGTTEPVHLGELPAAVQEDTIPETSVSQEAEEAVCPEIPSRSLSPSLGADVQTELIAPEEEEEAALGGGDDDEQADDSSSSPAHALGLPSGDSSPPCDEVSSPADAPQIPAEACGRASSPGPVSSEEEEEVREELNLAESVPDSHSPSCCSASPSRAVTKEVDPENESRPEEHKETSPEDTMSHDIIPEPSPESDSTGGLDENGPDSEHISTRSVGDSVTTSPPPVASESLNSHQDVSLELHCIPSISLKEVDCLDNVVQEDAEEDDIVPKGDGGEEDIVPEGAAEEEDRDVSEDKEEVTGKKTQRASSAGDTEGQLPGLNGTEKLASITSSEVPVVLVTHQDDLGEEEGVGNSDEDLYRGAEELPPAQVKPTEPVPLFEITLPKVEDRCSLAPAVDILSYSEREWKGNTAKSTLIRKGYKEMSHRFGSLRRVRGDNYCALRATLFQVLSNSTQLPTWLLQEDFIMLPKELEARDGLVSQWTFPGECQQVDGTGDATQQLKYYMELLRNRWQAAVGCSSVAERQQLCERVFQGGEEELGLLEALKLLMLARAVELHSCMQGGGDVPVFCWLLFARDSSECPRAFLSNHLSRVGFSGGLEQVEMFLLGYTLQCTIQVYRLYMADTEEFLTYYPDDHKEDWPSVCLVTEDDRHYNVPVGEEADRHNNVPVGEADGHYNVVPVGEEATELAEEFALS